MIGGAWGGEIQSAKGMDQGKEEWKMRRIVTEGGREGGSGEERHCWRRRREGRDGGAEGEEGTPNRRGGGSSSKEGMKEKRIKVRKKW